MANSLMSVLYGATAMGCLVITGIFLRHWRLSVDRLFLFFAWAFGLLAIYYTLRGLAPRESDGNIGIFAIRFAAFALILAGIVQKNRRP